MIKNKFLIFIILVLALLSIGVASAQDSSSLNINSTQDAVSDLETTVSSGDGNSKLQSAGNDDVLSANPDSFDDLQKVINAKGDNSELVLNYSYKYTGGEDFTGITITQNNFTINGNGYTLDANNNGRIFYITGNNVTLKNLNFVNATVGANGGAIYNTGANLTLLDSKFASITAYNNGGAIYNTGTNLNVNNTIFKDIVVNANGGAIWSQGDNLTVFASSFTNITANVAGGAIYTRGANLKITNSKFSDITTNSGDGGAVNNNGDNFTVTNSTFTDNYAKAPSYVDSTGGGAIWYNGTNFVITDSTFSGNTANNDGGAIWYTGTTLTINNSKFEKNTADSLSNSHGLGGAVYHNGANLNVINSTFTTNVANSVGSQDTLVGGAIYHNGANLTIKESRFTSNGGIYQLGDNTTVSSSNFTSNLQALSIRGNNFDVRNSNFTENTYAIYSAYEGQNTFSNFSVNNSKFIANEHVFYNFAINFRVVNSTVTNTSCSYMQGVVIYNLGNNFIIEDSTVTNTTSWTNGGVILNGGSNFTIKNSTFINAKTSDGAIYSGGDNFNVLNSTFINYYTNNWGGVINNNGNNLTVKDSRFIGSNANYAAVIYNRGNNFNVMNSTFINSTARYGGGAIRNYGSNFKVANSTFINSTAYESGAAIYNGGDNFNVMNSTFTNNKVTFSSIDSRYYGGGAIFNQGGNSNVINSTFTNNTAPYSYGGAIVNRVDNFNVINSTFTNSEARIAGTIYNAGQYFKVANSKFINSTSTLVDSNYGGAGTIYNTGSYAIISNSTFINSTSAYCGGTIYNEADSFTIANSTFDNSTAGYDGGVIYNNAYNFIIENSTFSNAIAGSNGGMICNHGGFKFKIINSTFTNATAKGNAGGKVFSNYDNDDYFYYYYGGGIIWNSGYYFTVANSTFINGTAKLNNKGDHYYSGGGAILNYNNDFIITNSTFVGNIANGTDYNFGGGAIYNYKGNVEVSYSNFTDNDAVTGTAIYNPKDSTISLSNNTYSDISESTKTIFNNGLITSPVVITVLGNESIPVDLYANVTLFASVATEDGASIAGQNLTFFVDDGEESSIYVAVANPNGNYTSLENYYINSIAPIKVSATYAGTTGEISVKTGFLLSGDIPSNITLIVVDNPQFAEPIYVNATVSVAGGAKINVIPTGNITFVVKDEQGKVVMNSSEITLDNVSKASHIFQYLNAGTYTVWATYDGNDRFKGNSTSASLTVVKVPNAELKIKTTNVHVEEDSLITVQVPDHATGNVTISVGGTDYNATIDPETSLASITVKFKTEGNQTLTAKYNGDMNYESVKGDSATLTITKNSVYNFTINAPDTEIGNSPVITVILPGDINADGTISIDGGAKQVITFVNGTGVYTGPSNLNVGTHTVIVTYAGNDKYVGRNVSGTFNITDILKYDMNVTINSDSFKVGDNVTITVAISKEALGGNVSVTLDDTTILTKKADGNTLEFTFTNLSVGPHSIKVNYTGYGLYGYREQSNDITVEKWDSNMNVIVPNPVKVLEDTKIVIVLPKDATGDIELNFSNGESYDVKVVNGSATIDLPSLPEGQYSFNLSYSGDNKYLPDSDSRTFTVSKISEYTMNITAADAKVGEDAIIDLNLPGGASGNVTITIDGVTYKPAIVNDIARITLNNLTDGVHTIFATYSGDGTYSSSYTTGSINVSKIDDYELAIDAAPIKMGEDAIIKVTAPEGADGRIVININNQDYVANIVDNVATFTVSGLVNGNYTITATYDGNDRYDKKQNTSEITVSGYAMSAKADNIKVGENATIIVNLPANATGSVSVTINNKSYNATINNGEAIITIPDLAAGDYSATVIYSGDGNYTANSAKVTFTVSEVSNINLTADDVVMIYKDGSRLYATLLDAKGNPIANATISFTINGVTYNRTTDANGSASLALNLVHGTYTATVGYENTTVNASVVIKSSIAANDLVKMYRNDTQFYATFLDVGAKPLANTNVTFNINGVFYTRQTDANGTAKLNINLNPGNYTLTAYNPVNEEQIGFNVLVKSLIETSDLTKYYMNESRFVAKIYNSNGTLAANKEVTFNINGVLYPRSSDENGTVSLAINLRPGDYIITSTYGNLSIGNNVKVLPTLKTSDLSMKYGDGSVFTAKTLDSQGNPLANQNVVFNVNGVFYNRTTGNDGVASLNINLISGEYIITSYWNDYEIGNKITIA